MFSPVPFNHYFIFFPLVFISCPNRFLISKPTMNHHTLSLCVRSFTFCIHFPPNPQGTVKNDTFAVAPERAVSCYSVPPQSPHPLTKPPQLPSLLLLHHVLQTLSKPAEKCHASPEHNTATHRIRSSSFSTLAKVATLFFNKYKCPGPPCKRQTDRWKPLCTGPEETNPGCVSCPAQPFPQVPQGSRAAPHCGQAQGTSTHGQRAGGWILCLLLFCAHIALERHNNR